MKIRKEKTFDTVTFFRKVKQILAERMERMERMNLSEQKEFMRKVREGAIKIFLN